MTEMTATARIQALGPLNSMLFLIERSADQVSICPFRLSVSRINVEKFWIKPILKSFITIKVMKILKII